MNKKVYSKPAMREVQLQVQGHLLVDSVLSNVGVGGGTSTSRSLVAAAASSRTGTTMTSNRED